jgi:hypothetical protein
MAEGADMVGLGMVGLGMVGLGVVNPDTSGIASRVVDETCAASPGS